MDEIIEILKFRDGITREEAEDLCNVCLDEMDIAIAEGGGVIEAERIFTDCLGLEPDYIPQFWLDR